MTGILLHLSSRRTAFYLTLGLVLAAACFQGRSAAAARSGGGERRRVEILIASAAARRGGHDNRAALRLLEEARSLALRIKYREGEARSLTELGETFFQQSALQKAETAQNAALPIWRELRDRAGEARALHDLGEVCMRLGELQRAAAALEEAAAIRRELGDTSGLASTLLDQNFLAIRQGQWQKALTALKEAQSLVADREAEPYLAGQVAMSLGEVYEAYGQLDASLRYFTDALLLYRDRARDASAAVDASRRAGRVQARLGDFAGAIRQIEAGLSLARQIDNWFMVALCREDLGRVRLAAGLYAGARKDLGAAAALYRQTGNRREWARAQTFLGQTLHSQGERAAAANAYRKALKVFQSINDYTNEAALCFGLGKLELEERRLDEAGAYLKRSIALTEQLRENAASKDLRSSFLASVHDRYETYTEWLMLRHAGEPRRGFDVEAFEASELGRARSLLDSLKDQQRELRRVADPALLVEEERLQKEEQRLLDLRATLLSQRAAPESLKKVEDELVELRSRNETLQAQMNARAGKFIDLLRPAPPRFEEIRRQVVDAETSLLEYSLGGQKSYLWLVTPDGLSSYELPDKNSIEAAVRNLVGLLKRPPAGPEDAAALQAAVVEVSRLVLGPVAGRLRGSRLIVVPDGILQYVPFQLLTASFDADDPLVGRYEIVNAPSASILTVVRREAAERAPAPKLLAAFGAPVLTTSGAAKSNPRSVATRTQASEDKADGAFDPSKMQPLFFAPQELDELRSLAADDDSLIYSGFDATRANLQQADLRQYRILHFATHGLLNAEQPELSGLVLSLVDRDGRPLSGFVGLHDIYNLRAPADLVVLSACQTALGKEVRGEGLVGLTRGFMYAGASSVVASLWKVDDEATAELMKRFYANLLRKEMTPGAALRAAQNSIRQEPSWKSPYYWAAFTLQGEYRQVIRPAPTAGAAAFPKTIYIGALVSSLAVVALGMRRRGRAGVQRYSTLKK